MADINTFPDIPGYVSIKQAAKMLGVSDKRVYRYVEAGRLKAVRSGHAFMIPEEEVRNFKPNPTGRVRTQPPSWYEYRSQSKIFVTDIQVRIRPDQEAKLEEKLQKVLSDELHKFPGTMGRYILQDEDEPDLINIWLFWKETELPDASTRQKSLAAFQADFADVLDWETAQYHKRVAKIHT